jgi:hypothetical protein
MGRPQTSIRFALRKLRPKATLLSRQTRVFLKQSTDLTKGRLGQGHRSVAVVDILPPYERCIVEGTLLPAFPRSQQLEHAPLVIEIPIVSDGAKAPDLRKYSLVVFGFEHLSQVLEEGQDLYSPCSMRTWCFRVSRLSHCPRSLKLRSRLRGSDRDARSRNRGPVRVTETTARGSKRISLTATPQSAPCDSLGVLLG